MILINSLVLIGVLLIPLDFSCKAIKTENLPYGKFQLSSQISKALKSFVVFPVFTVLSVKELEHIIIPTLK